MEKNRMKQTEEERNAKTEQKLDALMEALHDAIVKAGYDAVYKSLTICEPTEEAGETSRREAWEKRVEHMSSTMLEDLGIHPLGPYYSPGGGGHLNIIPGYGKTTCAPVTLMLLNSKGWTHRMIGDWKIDWDNHESRTAQWQRWVFTCMKAHLINCAGTVKAVVVIVDHWNAAIFEREHGAELAAWRKRGVTFFFHLVTHQHSMSPIWVSLN